LGCTVLLTSIFAFFIEGDPWVIPATALIFLLIYFSRNQSNGFGYARIIGLIISFAFLGTYLLQRYSSEREFEKRKLLAGKISAERDPIAESLFLETEKKILNDSILKTYLRPSTMATGQVRDLAQLYFNSYWEKYSINVNVFGADECPMTALYTTSVSDPLKFDRLIDSIGIPTMSDRFFFMDNGSGRISYMARLPILNENRDSIPLGTLYIDFQSRYTPEEIGYPELLLDKMVSTRTDLSNYSYARYNQGKLISHYGTYPYELSDTLFRKASTDEYSFFKSDKYSHLVYKVRDNSFVILSLPRAGLLGLLTPFSYLILFFSLLVLIPYLWQEFVVQRHLRRISFKRRIQLSIVLILFISLLLIGGGTIVYIISNSNQKNLHNISEKIHSLLVETEYILGKDDGLSPFKSEDIAYALTRQANVFFADINIFDPYGQLYASSRPKIFEEGLVSKKMNPEAYYYLSVRKTSEYIHEEHIGKLNYFSAYVPLRNNENKVIGYLNLPYFARQNELRKEIATFVVAIVNIYVLLIVLVVIAAIFLSNTVTEPLRLIQEKLGNIQLGRKNEVIEWKGQDEIGDLISEYNRMVSELAESADKLARSERESAWREMAKQVAHEIKNPLTPMKLSTQMLKRAWDDEAPGFDQRIERYTQNLIEQIDSLSHIATEFSNFAKMPKMVKEKVDLYALLQGAIDFHQGEQGVNISMDVQCASPCYILTDKEQMLRVFNNLLRNAIQAIPEDKAGLIDVTLKQEGKQYCFSVSDNGTGISDELREKIFSPNFTTKNAGMGLGLAMVKNIVESSEGRIWFESELGKGTVFYVELPQMA
jgi:signal transduction histidine kinase